MVVAIAKAKAGVPNARDYIGNADGASPAPRAGMNEWIKQAIAASNGALWNNGSWGQRDMRGKPGSLSVHATGRAVDNPAQILRRRISHSTVLIPETVHWNSRRESG